MRQATYKRMETLFRAHGGNPGASFAIFKSTKKRLPSAYDVLCAVTKSDPGTFEDFCSGFGYDSDSRKAFATWEAVVKEWNDVRAFFTPAELEQLQEIAV